MHPRSLIFLLFLTSLSQAMQCRSLVDAVMENKYYKEKYIMEICKKNKQKFIKSNFNKRQELVSITDIELRKINFALSDISKMHKKEVNRLCQGHVILNINGEKKETLNFCKQTKLKLFELFSDLFFTYHSK